MPNIAICEDDKHEAAVVRKLMEEYIGRRQDLSFDVFADAEQLLAATDNGYNIYILDIFMPGINGMELAKMLRDKHEDAVIIFLTSSFELAIEAFEVEAMSYLTKPVDACKLFKALDKALAHFDSKATRYTYLDVPGSKLRLAVDDIMYIEVEGHVLKYHMSYGEILSSKTLRVPFVKAIPDLFADPRFVRSHHSFLVNINHVVQCKKFEFIMKNDARIPISRTKFNSIMKRHFN